MNQESKNYKNVTDKEEHLGEVYLTQLEMGVDMRHINEYIDAGHPDVKVYIENLEDHITYLYHQLLQYELDNDTILHTIGLDEERNERVRNEQL
ncbi:hypothetical protein [Pantoea sp. FN0305]|uniref:hypothetical protein n=1 Tax=Pantoea sp. FN0305 TaxID=3418559 RepID=UPI003CF87CDC